MRSAPRLSCLPDCPDSASTQPDAHLPQFDPMYRCQVLLKPSVRGFRECLQKSPVCSLWNHSFLDESWRLNISSLSGHKDELQISDSCRDLPSDLHWLAILKSVGLVLPLEYSKESCRSYVPCRCNMPENNRNNACRVEDSRIVGVHCATQAEAPPLPQLQTLHKDGIHACVTARARHFFLLRPRVPSRRTHQQ